MKRFSGEYIHSIDAKGRIVVPSRFRDAFVSKMIVTKGFEGCLSIYTEAMWDAIVERLMQLPQTKKEARDYVRLFMSKAMECEIDNQNRINLPPGLIKEGQLNKQCVFVGVLDHIELWDQSHWDDYCANNGESFESIAESVTDFLKGSHGSL
jgi:MraZ protein